MTMPNNINGTTLEDDSILSFLTSDFLESQTTNSTSFDTTHFFDSLPTDNNIKYHDLLHPPSPPTSVGTFSESSGSPQHTNMDSCDEGSGSDVPMESNPLDYWQYVYSDLTHSAPAFPILQDLTQQQPGAWPALAGVNAALLQASPISPIPSKIPNTPPSPTSSIKAEKSEKKPKRAKKQASAPAQTVALAPLAPLKPLMPLAPLVQLAPQPTPPSPPTSVHDVFIKQSPPLSPRIITPSTSSAPTSGGSAIRRPSIVPAITPNAARSNPVVVKSSLIPEDKPPTEAAMTAQAKRQERLIKNRAAALLSRKRKREHINLLETHTDLLKSANQDLTERVSELEENVKILTIERDTAREERDSARKECDRLHRQISVLAHHPQSSPFRVDMDLERNIRSGDADRGLNSKATGVVFMIILFSFALFNLPSGKLDTLMVGGSIDRPRLASSIVGRVNSYSSSPTISGKVRENTVQVKDLHNMTDLVVFSDNRALQTWLGHQPVVISSNESNDVSMEPKDKKTSVDKDTKSVGFVSQKQQQRPWVQPDAHQDINEPDRDAWLYCANLLYSFPSTNIVKATGSSQATNGEIRRPRMSIISPLDGVTGSSTTNDSKEMPPWMPNANPAETDEEQRYLRLDVEVTSSRVVSGKGLENHEQVIRFPLVPFGVFDNATSDLVPSKAAVPTPENTIVGSAPSVENRRASHGARSTRVNSKGGVTKTRRTSSRVNSRVASSSLDKGDPMPLDTIKEEPMDYYIKVEPMD